jgi:hypothetical protein
MTDLIATVTARPKMKNTGTAQASTHQIIMSRRLLTPSF